MSIADSIKYLQASRWVQQTLKKDPNNIEALLELASMLGTLNTPNLPRKREVLNRILALEPANEKARAMLFELDRAAIGGDPSRLSAAVILTPKPAVEFSEKPLIARYSIFRQVFYYSFLAGAVLLGLQIYNEDIALILGALLLLLLIPIWSISVVVEIGAAELKVSRLFGVARTEIAWGDIQAFTLHRESRGMTVISRDGRAVNISSRISGYTFIVDILRQQRPDLFAAMHASNETEPSSFQPGETQVFQKNALIKYGPLFLLLLGLLVFLGTVVTAQCLVAIPMGLLVWVMARSTLQAPYLLKVEGDRLLVKSFRREQVFSFEQLKGIELVRTYRYSRQGRGHTRLHIRVALQDGNFFRLAGFSGGDRHLYDYLRNWWQAKQSA